MKWQSIFARGKELTAQQARDYISSQPPNTVQIIDVRQPKEYEEAHIPGAILIPLNEIQRRIDEIDKERHTIVYCRSGSRSSAACQLLGENQVAHALNLRGGMLQWQGNRAQGDETFGLEYFVRGDFKSAFAMAYQMEVGLKQFYLFAATRASDPPSEDLLRYMARLEDGHMAKLRARHREEELPQETADAILEGGFTSRDLADSFSDHLGNRESIIQLAMMFEAQALDLYSRLARRYGEPEVQSFFLEMAGEEQAHLDKLAQEMDKLLA
jgi:rhodanese-related sulfurtransferase/rubrerythrin